MKRAFPTVFRLRTVTPDDAEALLRIYAPYVEETAISFEYAVPTAAEFRRRIEIIRQKYPYLAAEDEAGRLLGYAYTHDFIAREAYDHCAETTIYIGRDLRRSGLGKALYGALEDISRAQNLFNLYACIGEPIVPDEYLTDNSIRFHEHLGFRRIGVFERCGYKFGRWYNMVWAEKLLAAHPVQPKAVVPFSALDSAAVRGILCRHSTL